MAATVYFKPDLVDTVKEIVNDKQIFDCALFLDITEDDVPHIIDMIDSGAITKSVVVSYRDPIIEWSQYCSDNGLEPFWQMRGIKIAKKNAAGNLFGTTDTTYSAYNVGEWMELPSVVDKAIQRMIPPFSNSIYEMAKVDSSTLDVFRSWLNLFDEPVAKDRVNDVLVSARQGYVFCYKESKYYFDVDDTYPPYHNNDNATIATRKRFWSKYLFLIDCSTAVGDNVFVYKTMGEGQVLPTIFKTMNRYLTLVSDPTNKYENNPWIV